MKFIFVFVFLSNLKSCQKDFLDEKEITLCVFLGLPQAVHALRQGDLLETFPLWQLRLVVDLWDSRMLRGAANHHDALLTSEFLPVMKNMVDRALDSWLKGEDGDSAVSFLQRFCLGLDYTVVVSLSSLLEKTIRRFFLECEYFPQEHSSGRVVIVTAVFFFFPKHWMCLCMFSMTGCSTLMS